MREPWEDAINSQSKKGVLAWGFYLQEEEKPLTENQRSESFEGEESIFFCEEGAWVSFGGKGLFVGMWEFLARGVNILFYIGHLFIISICVPIKRREEESLL